MQGANISNSVSITPAVPMPQNVMNDHHSKSMGLKVGIKFERLLVSYEDIIN